MDSNKYLTLFLLLLWNCFMAWEYTIQNTLNHVQYPIVRYDLLILPILVFFTGYVVYVLIKKKETKKS